MQDRGEGSLSKASIALVAAGISIAFCFGARADDCAPLTIATSVDLVPTSDNTSQFVPVTIQGTPKLMLLDTGSVVSEITPQAADEMGLSRRRLGFRQINIAGEASSEAAIVPEFGLGRLNAKSIEFVVAPDKKLFGGNKEIIGLIGSNILRQYDVDIDFGAHKLNLLSPDHCEGKVIYWRASAVAVVPIEVLPSGHILLTVKLDGQDVPAILDTGASSSTLTIPTAENDFKLTLGSPDTPFVRDLQDKPGAATYKHRFATLSFGDVAVGNPQFAIIPDFLDHPLELMPETGSHLVDPSKRAETAPMLLGMNILRHLHLYIAYKEKNLYITPGSASPTSGASNAPSTAQQQ